MRALANNEIQQVSGAITVTINDCYSTEYLLAIREDATREATIVGIGAGAIATGLTSTAMYHLGVGILTSGMGGAIAGLAAYAYVYTTSYDSYELWPWNF